MTTPPERLRRLQVFLEQDPDNPTLHAEAFDCALAAGDFSAAQHLLEQAQKKHFDPAGWTFRLATLLIAKRDWPRAEETLSALQAECGPHPAIVHNLAWIAFSLGDLNRARELLLPLVESAPGEGAIQVLFLRVLHRLAEFDFALETAQGLEQSGVLAPAAAGVASLIAIDHDELGLARQWAQRALRADPMQIEALVTRASIALDEAEGSLACEFAERALTLHPQDGRAASVLGLARLMKFEFDGARQSFERALLTLPEHIGTWIALGWTCLMSRDLEGARHAFQSAMDLDRNFSESHGGLAVVEALSGQTESARTHIKIAQALDPRDLSSQYAQALLSGEAQHPDKFLRVATRALKVRGVPWPQSPETKH